MKLLVVLTLVAVAAAAPQQRFKRQNFFGGTGGALAQLLRSDSTPNDGSGNYRYSYEQSDGHKQQEQGELRNRGTANEAIAVKGSYSWVGPDGVTYDINYTADEHGYQPTIELAPFGVIPDAIIRTITG